MFEIAIALVAGFALTGIRRSRMDVAPTSPSGTTASWPRMRAASVRRRPRHCCDRSPRPVVVIAIGVLRSAPVSRTERPATTATSASTRPEVQAASDQSRASTFPPFVVICWPLPARRLCDVGGPSPSCWRSCSASFRERHPRVSLGLPLCVRDSLSRRNNATLHSGEKTPLIIHHGIFERATGRLWIGCQLHNQLIAKLGQVGPVAYCHG